jgi:hypothetical protein
VVALAIGIFVLSAAAFAGANTPSAGGGKSKPECGVRSTGMMWPDEANRDTGALRLAAQSGLLELCGKHRDGYRWESVSVNVWQLRSEVKASRIRATDEYGTEDATNSPAADDGASENRDAQDRSNDRSNDRFNDRANSSGHQRGFFQAIRSVLGI